LRLTQSGAVTNAVSGTFTSLSGAAGNSIFLERSNYSLTLNNTDASSFSGIISGAGSVTKQGSGSLTLGGANTYSGATAVRGGSLVFGAANVLANTSAVTIANATLTSGSFSDTVASLTSGTGTINMTIAAGTVGSLSMAGLTLNGSNTLALTLDNPTLGRYSLFNYTGSRTGTFSSVTGASDWNVIYGDASNSTIDLQQKANQAWSVTPSGARALVNTSVALTGLLTNTSGSGAASLTVSASSTGQLTVSSLPTGTIVGGSSAAVNASIAAGSTLGSRTWTIVNTDANAITTSATATGTLTVVQNRTYTSPATIDLGRVLVGQSVSNQAVVTSLQSFETTATGTLGGSGSLFNGIALTGSNVVFNGVLTAGTYALSGSVTGTAGTTIGGTYSLGSTNEFGDFTSAAASVTFTGTAIDPALASFASGSTSTLLTLDFGSVNQDSSVSPLSFDIFNLVQTAGFTADLALYEIDAIQATNPEITTDLALFDDLVAGASRLFAVSLSTATVGTFENTYVLRLKSANNGTIYQADTPQSLTLVGKAVIIVPEPGALALAGIGLAGGIIAACKRGRSRSSRTRPPAAGC
jgi:fibronectin-binding autotransporter adhesin